MKFKRFTKLTIGASVAGLISAMLMSFGGVAQADCYQYNPNGFTTSSTPVFNNICGTPEGINNESDFVRIRHNVNGNDEDNNNNPGYTVGALNTTCNNNDKYDVWNYLHNDASSDDNNNGSGSAVAHNVMTHMTAPLGTTASSYTFGDTVTASNAASVHDSVTLNCSDGQYKLSLVPGSVHIYSIPYGAWKDLSDGSINSAVKLGSPNFGSGDMWGCWNYRIVVVYQVTIQKTTPTPPQVTATCDLFTITASEDRKVTVSQFKYTAVNANFKNVVVNWGDSHSNTYTSGVVGQTHQLPGSPNRFEIVATANFVDVNGKSISSSGANCAQVVTFTPNTPPTITPPPSTPPTTTPPTELVNTGVGSVLGLFAVASAAGATIYRRLLSRKLSRQ